MSPSADNTGRGRTDSNVTPGLVPNTPVDRSEETLLSRKERRKSRRETLRNFNELALAFEESDKTNKKEREPQEGRLNAKPSNKPHFHELTLQQMAQGVHKMHFNNAPKNKKQAEEAFCVLQGLNSTVFRTPPKGDREFPEEEEPKKSLSLNWWNVLGRVSDLGVW
ncbi:hypothetical protein NM208_g5030 [Fusarium decemcellulare]|uniref:Uncharacterized protein n=1 Tax=Fusarium decemcellulare TaxID=57161 RepID=A0ACC1SIG5_9HYPO|nr:hypothetical protein NM208_g5030 [Fusarium decemcellulare]